MAADNILKSFFVRLGFKVDQQGQRNFVEGIASLGKGFSELAKTGLAAGTALTASTTVMAKQMESLYFASQRTGASTRELKEFSFAASQIGVSAERAQAAIEGMAAARRTNPGLNGLLASFGINPRETDNAKAMVQLLVKLHSMGGPGTMGYAVATQYAAMFGIDEGTLNQLERGLPEMQKFIKIQADMFKVAGINPEDEAKASHAFMDDSRELASRIGNLADIIAYRLLPTGERVISWLENAVTWLTKADAATGGWSSKILGVVSAIGGLGALKGGLGLAGNLLGRGGAAAAGGAGGAGAISSLVGTILTTGLIALLAAAVFAMFKPDVVAKMLGLDPHGHQISDAIQKPFVSAAHAIQEMHKQVQVTGGYVKALSIVPGTIGSLARMVAGFEGHVKNGYGLYKDIAGNITAGYGHLVKPGEDFSHLDKAGALALLAKDLGSAVATVSRLVKVHLSHNQADALADFVFNLGGDKFAHSTLLKKLNSGDFAGAADQFQYWNKAMNNGHLVVNSGLAARRSAEADLFRAPDKSITVHQNADIKVTGVSDPHEAGRAAGTAASHAFSDMLRNMKEAVY